jgi:hypothetical protein
VNEQYALVHDQIEWSARITEHSPVHTIPIDIIYDPRVLKTDRRVLLGSGGYGEELLGSTEGVRKFGELGIAAAFMIHPFDKKKIPAIDHDQLRLWIETVLIEGPYVAAEWLNTRANRPPDTPLDLFGSSMSGGGHIMSVAHAPEKSSIVEIKASAGVNDLSVELSEKARIHMFLKTMGANMLQPEQRIDKDRRNIRAGLEVARRAVIDIAQQRFNTKVGYAVTADLIPSIAAIHEHKGEDFGFWVGTDDPVVVQATIEQLLDTVHLSHILRTYEGSHAALYANGSRRQLAAIGAHIHERRRASMTSTN